ncbi:MAG: CPBP family intramembrane glutamic endopeptidase [Polyangiaceae bacterium]
MTLGQAVRPIAAVYVVAAVVTLAGVYLYSGRALWLHPSPSASAPWLRGAAASGLLGLAFAAFVVVVTRLTVPRLSWARQLHATLHPLARDLSRGQIVVLALCSGVAEEVVFRGWLQPLIGFWLASMLFGFVHQLPGPSRWIWVAWATSAGLALGLIFEVTGHLLGPVVAHATINGVNLQYLQSFDGSRPVSAPS